MAKKTYPVVHLDDRALNIFTDGSSYQAPRRGGIGFRIVTVDTAGREVVMDEQPAGVAAGTNNEMELLACIAALEYVGGRYSPVDVSSFSKIVIHTDSTYVQGCYDAARFRWPTTGWLDRDGNPVVNAPLWKRLVKAADKTGKRVEIVWHKGHSATNPHNKAADKLAKNSAKGPLREPLSIKRVRRKTSGFPTEPGSIRAEGQRLTLRIITDRWLPAQKLFEYRCEVVSRRSPYRGRVDILFSEIPLDAGHLYYVRLNDEPRRPRIGKVFREIES